jgi:hypothetical protein
VFKKWGRYVLWIALLPACKEAILQQQSNSSNVRTQNESELSSAKAFKSSLCASAFNSEASAADILKSVKEFLQKYPAPTETAPQETKDVYKLLDGVSKLAPGEVVEFFESEYFTQLVKSASQITTVDTDIKKAPAEPSVTVAASTKTASQVQASTTSNSQSQNGDGKISIVHELDVFISDLKEEGVLPAVLLSLGVAGLLHGVYEAKHLWHEFSHAKAGKDSFVKGSVFTAALLHAGLSAAFVGMMAKNLNAEATHDEELAMGGMHIGTGITAIVTGSYGFYKGFNPKSEVDQAVVAKKTDGDSIAGKAVRDPGKQKIDGSQTGIKKGLIATSVVSLGIGIFEAAMGFTHVLALDEKSSQVPMQKLLLELSQKLMTLKKGC